MAVPDNALAPPQAFHRLCRRNLRLLRPSGSRSPFINARNASASASMAWASNRRAPLLKTAVSGSSIVSG